MGMIFHQYGDWVDACDTLGDKDRQAIRRHISRLERPPLFSFVSLPATDGAATISQTSIASVKRQLYPHWEMWLPGCSKAIGAMAEPRLRIGLAQAGSDQVSLFNASLAAAEGEFLLPLPSDAILAEAALYELAAAIAEHPSVDIVYTDEDCVDAAGKRAKPRFKTDWDPELALGCNAIGLLVAYRKKLLDRLGGMRPSASGTALALYDLSLRAAFSTSPSGIHHIPAVLCHRLCYAESSFAWDAEGARQVVRRHLIESGVRAGVVPAPLAPSWNRIIREVPDPAPLDSVIVPTRDCAELLERCADALLTRTAYPALELLVVDNDSHEAATLELFRSLSRDPRVRVLSHPGTFNYAAINNRAAREAGGEILLLLNSDTDVIRPDWLGEMVSHAVRPDVGAVGAKLLYANERVQHAGVVLGPGPTLHHQFRLSDYLDPGPFGEIALTRTVSAVTGACLAIRRSVFFEIGGLDENLRVALNDIDLCLRLGDYGYRIVWTPFAELFHLEKATRGDDDTPEKQALFAKELQYFCQTWGSLMDNDPFYNKNVIYGWGNAFVFAQPRRERPWWRRARSYAVIG
jgi:GT2 family glycosyltransferase